MLSPSAHTPIHFLACVQHHCRNCGRVLCSTCCSDKVILIHLGAVDPELTCIECKAKLLD